MIFTNKENNIVETALQKLEEITGWEGRWETASEGVDGFLFLKKQGIQEAFATEVKSVFHPAHLPRLLDIREKHGRALALGGRISQGMKEQLTEANIHYLESGGNARIAEGGIFIFIEGKKGGLSQQRKHLFTNASIRLIFQLLLEPGLLKEPYRKIAAVTGASLDNLSKTIFTLKENGYLTALRKREYAFTDKDALLQRWVPAYGERIKPRLLIGQFRFLKDDHWKGLPLDENKTQWGGEPAADLKTGMLRPETFALYTLETKAGLTKNYRLIPDLKGPVKAYRSFWNMERFPGKTVPLMLIYADLLLSGSARNAEMAKALLDAEQKPVLPTI
ncbi:MAG TPA: hypothetical protein ENJ95_08915 [Bacteroidetes bacterium]|nr:hypothetical protein [Bacteroidota bacterium]